MLLTPPPCIAMFIGCSSTDTFGDDASSSTSSSSSRTGYLRSSVQQQYSSSSRSTVQRSVSSSSRSTVQRSVSSSATSVDSVPQRAAHYTVIATNRGTQAVSDFMFTHGPVPSGAIFDPLRSSNSCIHNGNDVQCTTSLALGEAKSFDITYTVNSSVSCTVTKLLQTVKSITSTTANNVATSVSCYMETLDDATDIQMIDTSSSVSSSTSSHVDTSVLGASIELRSSSSQGYKPYTMPKTGADNYAFTSRIDQSVTLVQKAQESGKVSMLPFMLVMCFSIISVIVVLRTIKMKKLA